jgi:hypothetical protein
MDTTILSTIRGMIRTGTTADGPCLSTTAGVADGITTAGAAATMITGIALTDGHLTMVTATVTRGRSLS